MNDRSCRHVRGATALACALLAFCSAGARGQEGPPPGAGGPPLAELKAMAQTGELFTAIRLRDRAAAEAALDKGADPNRPNWLGMSALEWAVFRDDSSIIDLLLQRGANLDNGLYGPGSPLLFAVITHQEDRALALLDKGIKTAPRRPDGATLLMLAAAYGAPRVIERLHPTATDLAQRDVDGADALIYAARLGQVESARRLLAAGAKVDTADKHGRTPLIYAAANGYAPMVALLLSRGAKASRVDRQGASALHLAARYNGDVAIAQQLLRAGAPASSPDGKGRTPLALAEARRFTALARALRAAGARRGAAIVALAPRPAVEKSLGAMQSGMKRFLAQSSCISCHHQGIGLAALGYARMRGFAVEKGLIEDNAKRVAGEFQKLGPLAMAAAQDPSLRPALPAVDMEELPITAGYVLWGLAANQVPPSPGLAGLAMAVAQDQKPDGHWQFTLYRGPMQSSYFTTTAFNVLAMRRYLPPDQQASCLSRAQQWLRTAPVVTSEDRSSRLLGLHWAGAEPKGLSTFVQDLLARQRPDGGWGTKSSGRSDAYSTGIALYSLQVAGGVPAASPAVRRGLDYLLRTQDEDGGWYMNKTIGPFNFFFDAGFPGGESQYISFAATGWATMALMEAAAPRSVARK